jgi:hypothetical protein
LYPKWYIHEPQRYFAYLLKGMMKHQVQIEEVESRTKNRDIRPDIKIDNQQKKIKKKIKMPR